jgi:hypothetical protein
LALVGLPKPAQYVKEETLATAVFLLRSPAQAVAEVVVVLLTRREVAEVVAGVHSQTQMAQLLVEPGQ